VTGLYILNNNSNSYITDAAAAVGVTNEEKIIEVLL